uniref:Uncharacterized protein n=1 Tax=Avena sativa TaxID=4498 RepID=A0ACD6A7W0_AVESA
MPLLSGSESCGGARPASPATADSPRSSSSSLSPPRLSPDARAFTPRPFALLSSLLLVPVTLPPPPSNSKKATALVPRPVCAYPSSHPVSLAAMSEHLPLRSSVGSRGSAPPSHYNHDQYQQQQHVTSYPRPHGNPDPLASVWIRRLHLTPNPPPPPPPHSSFAPPPPPLHEHDAVSNRSAGFGPFRWSPRPPRDAPAGAWDAIPAQGGGPPMMSPFFHSQAPPLRDAPVGAWDAAPVPCGRPPMMSPFFRSQPPPLPAVADVGEFAPVRTAIGFCSGTGAGGFPGLSSRAIVDVNPHASWLATPAAGSAYPNHAVDMVHIRTSHVRLFSYTSLLLVLEAFS